MTPWQKAQQWHDRYFPESNFGLAVAENIARPDGFVVSFDDVFIMGQEVYWDDAAHSIEAGPPNAWFVQLAAVADGANAHERFLSAATKPHQYVLWQRRNDGRIRARRCLDILSKTQRKE
jgi:hypothetical protein